MRGQLAALHAPGGEERTNLRRVPIPRLLHVDADILGELPELLDAHDIPRAAACVVSGPTTTGLHAAEVARLLDAPPPFVAAAATNAVVEQAVDEARRRRARLILGVGGGKPIDVAKLVAAKIDASFVSIPTTPSNDGIASPVAVIRNAEGYPQSLAARMPVGVVADLGLLREAPEAGIRAGIGDLLANLSAVDDWDLVASQGHEPLDDFARLLALSGAETLLRFPRACTVPLHDVDLLRALLNGLVLSGVAMEIAGSSRPCSGAEHLFSHALDRIAAAPAPHGVQVALGTLLFQAHRGAEWEPLRGAMQNFGLPTSAADAGLTEDEVIEALLLAPTVRPNRRTILDEKPLDRASAKQLAIRAGVL